MTVREDECMEDIDGGFERGADDEAKPVKALKPRNRPTLILAGVAAVSALFMIVGAFQWWQAGHDESLALAQTRDEVMVLAHNHIETLNSLDYRDVKGGIATWRAVTTGDLRNQLTDVKASDITNLAEQKKVTTGKVVDEALTDLNIKNGTATVIASLEVTVKGTTGEPVIKRNRYTAELLQVKGTWLLDKLLQMAVTLK